MLKAISNINTTAGVDFTLAVILVLSKLTYNIFSNIFHNQTHIEVLAMAVRFVKSDYRFTYLDSCNEKHIFNFIQYTDATAVQTVDELFSDSEVIPISLCNNTKDVLVFNVESQLSI